MGMVQPSPSISAEDLVWLCQQLHEPLSALLKYRAKAAAEWYEAAVKNWKRLNPEK